jgi:hypothetical protein
METTNVYVNLEGQSSRDWCLGSEELISKYLYIARIKLDLLGRGACLIVLVMLNIGLCYYRIIMQITCIEYMIIPFHCRGFLFQGFKSDKISFLR